MATTSASISSRCCHTSTYKASDVSRVQRIGVQPDSAPRVQLTLHHKNDSQSRIITQACCSQSSRPDKISGESNRAVHAGRPRRRPHLQPKWNLLRGTPLHLSAPLCHPRSNPNLSQAPSKPAHTCPHLTFSPATSIQASLGNPGDVASLSLDAEPSSSLGFRVADFEWSEGSVSSSSSSGSIGQSEASTHLDSTVRLVETAMLAATAGLAFFLSNLLRLESYFGSFFPLPVVISAMRWDAAAGRKTMVATALLLFVLSGPLKSLNYVLMHGCLGLTMGALWKWRVPWPLSLITCTLVRLAGLLGFVALSSWLLRENLLALITANAHAMLSQTLASMGSSLVPSMAFIYAASGAVLVINCLAYVALLHLLYAIFLRRLGIKNALPLPAWLERAF